MFSQTQYHVQEHNDVLNIEKFKNSMINEDFKKWFILQIA